MQFKESKWIGGHEKRRSLAAAAQPPKRGIFLGRDSVYDMVGVIERLQDVFRFSLSFLRSPLPPKAPSSSRKTLLNPLNYPNSVVSLPTLSSRLPGRGFRLRPNGWRQEAERIAAVALALPFGRDGGLRKRLISQIARGRSGAYLELKGRIFS